MSAKAMGWVLEHSPVVGAARLVLVVLADRADSDGRNAYPSVQSIAAHAKCSESTVHRVLRQLEDEGHVEREGISSFRTVAYRVVMEEPSTLPGSDPRPSDPRTLGPSHDRTLPGSDPSDPAPVDPPTIGPKPTAEPSIERTTSSLVAEVFGVWVTATQRNAERTKLSPDRQRRIKKALDSHGLETCLAAVRNIGADAWARGANDRGRRFDDIDHALGTAERIERWADGAPRTSAQTTPPRLANSRDLSRFENL